MQAWWRFNRTLFIKTEQGQVWPQRLQFASAWYTVLSKLGQRKHSTQ